MANRPAGEARPRPDRLRIVELLHDAMKSSNLTYAELARRVGLSNPWVYAMLVGRRPMSMKNACKIAAALGYRLGLVALDAGPRAVITSDLPKPMRVEGEVALKMIESGLDPVEWDL